MLQEKKSGPGNRLDSNVQVDVPSSPAGIATSRMHSNRGVPRRLIPDHVVSLLASRADGAKTSGAGAYCSRTLRQNKKRSRIAPRRWNSGEIGVACNVRELYTSLKSGLRVYHDDQSARARGKCNPRQTAELSSRGGTQ